MKKITLVAILLIFLGLSVDAQRWRLVRYRAYGGITSVNYFGDIGGAVSESNWFGVKDLDIQATRPAIHLGALYKIFEYLDVKMNFNYGAIGGTDLNSRNAGRELEFKSSVFETSLQLDYFVYGTRKKTTGRIFSKRGMLNNYSNTKIYIFGGFGGAFFGEPEITPKSTLADRSSEFEVSSVFTPVVPIGVGLVYVLNSQWEFGAEIGGRMTFTDYVDGFSSRYSDGVNDIYYFSTISAVYRIRTARNGWPSFKRRF